jgi:hypothetical protein
MTVSLSIRSSDVRMEQLGHNGTDFNKIGYGSIFLKSVEKIQFLLKSDKNNCTLHEDKYEFLIIAQFLLE